MVDKDIVFEKVKQIQSCLKRIKDKTQGDPKLLEELDIEEIFILNVQRAVQSCIDLAAHIVADEGLGLPDELKENFVLLEKEKILNQTLSKRLQRMVGFRNIAIHEYSEIDPEILKSILLKDLKDIETFYTTLLKHFKLID